MQDLARIAELIDRHAPDDGIHETALPRVTLIRSDTVTAPMPTVYDPSFCLVAQGAKEARLGERCFHYAEGDFLLGAVDLPIMGTVTRASGDAPYLCLCVAFDMAALGDMVMEHAADDARPSLGLMIDRVTPPLADTAARMLSLLDTPQDAAALMPLVERELMWRLLSGPVGPLLRHMAGTAGQGARVARAVRWLRDHFAQSVSIEQLADIAGMSASAFHQHFRTVTGVSPLRFRTHLRLQEARRLMIADGLDAASAGFRVGYGSPSQFSRDYARTLGLPPRRDLERLQASGQVAVA